jgi:hypothetical protein
MIWIEGSDAHTEELVRRFDRAPKPMSYQGAFLERAWADYLALKGCDETQVDPDDFIRWTYAQAMAHRQPLYASMAKNWGVSVKAEEIAQVKTAEDFDQLIAIALERR